MSDEIKIIMEMLEQAKRDYSEGLAQQQSLEKLQASHPEIVQSSIHAETCRDRVQMVTEALLSLSRLEASSNGGWRPLRDVRKEHGYFWVNINGRYEIGIISYVTEIDLYHNTEKTRTYCWLPERPKDKRDVEFSLIDDSPAIPILPPPPETGGEG